MFWGWFGGFQWTFSGCLERPNTGKTARLPTQRHLPKNRKTMGAFLGFVGRKPVVILVPSLIKLYFRYAYNGLNMLHKLLNGDQSSRL